MRPEQTTGMTEAADIPAAKKLLRKAVIARRTSVPAERRGQAAEDVAQEAMKLIGLQRRAGRDCRIISGFLSIGEGLDTGPLLQRLHGAGHEKI